MSVFFGLVLSDRIFTRQGASQPEFSPERPAPKEIDLHYYQFNIGDYIKQTQHLTLEEDIAYRRLLDIYYDTELPLKKDIGFIARRIRISESITESVLREFFVEQDDGWHNNRADQEIAVYRSFLEKQKNNGKLGGRPKKTQAFPTDNPEETQEEPKKSLNSNHEPVTNNQEPVLKTKTHRGTRLPADMILSDDWALFCKKERPDLTPAEVFLEFKDYWVAQPGQKGVKTDWDATWRNWVRRQNAKKKGSVWDENERRKQQLADRIFGKRSTDDGRTIEAATVRLG